MALPTVDDVLVIVPKSITGTGDPMDIITCIPLLSSWGASRACHLSQADEPDCEKPLQRIVIVDHTVPEGVLQKNDTIAFCEEHFQILRGRA